MIRFKDIHIPKPCSVDYDSLPGNEVKRFCGNCKKQIYDFRGKDEAYLNEVFQKTGKVCGVYYADQLHISRLKIQRPFYYGFVTKIIGVGLFFKTLLSTYDVAASNTTTFKQKIIQTSPDSSKINTSYKGTYNKHAIFSVNVDIYINDSLYNSYALLNTQRIWLPDSIKPNDQIKLIVSTMRYNYAVNQKRKKHHRTKRNPNKKYYSNESKKEYHFKFKEKEEINVKINYHKTKNVFLKKRTPVTGIIVPAELW